MATRWGIDDLKSDNTPLHGYEWNHLARCANAQTQGALRALGAGVIEGLLVTAGAGLTVRVAAGHAIVAHLTHGYIWLACDDSSVTGLADDSDNYLFAAPEIAAVADAPDARESGAIDFVVQTGDSLAGAVLLAQITCAGGAVTAVVDKRELRGGAGILGDLIEAGRVVGAATSEGAPLMMEPAEAAIVLPAGGKWYIGGQRIHLGDDIIIAVPTGKPEGVYGFLSIDPETDLPHVAEGHWFDSFPTGGALVALRALGLACLGLAVTDDLDVTALDTHAASGRADLLYTQAGLLALIAQGGGDGPPPVELVTREAFDALAARVTALENAAGIDDDVAVLDDTENDRAMTQQLATYQVRHDPGLARYLEISIPSPRYSGMAQVTGDGTVLPDVRGGGNATLDVGADEIA